MKSQQHQAHANRQYSVDDNPSWLVQQVTSPSLRSTLIYLTLAFPLGIVYFVFLVTGLALGISLSIIWIGIPILLFMFASVRKMITFERSMANELLHVNLPIVPSQDVPQQGWWSGIQQDIRDTRLWNAITYLLLKMPLGILSFTLVVGLGAAAFGFIVMPIVYWLSTIFQFPIMPGFFEIDSWTRAMTASLIGIGLAIAAIACFRWLGNMWVYLMKTMLQP